MRKMDPAQELLKEKIDKDHLPGHIAIIMDGNGRWAKQRGKPRVFGHRNGVKAVRATTEAAAELGVNYLTLYAFSTENWSRPAMEVGALMSLLVDTLHKEIATLMENDIRLNAIGELEKLPGSTYKALVKGMEQTEQNKRMTLTLALNYSSRWEIGEMVKKIGERIASGEIEPDQIDQGLLRENLSDPELPDPELLIRTSGEKRISNFLLYQLAYTELYFADVFWPDFDKSEFYKAILDYQNRERRFGKISEQLVS